MLFKNMKKIITVLVIFLLFLSYGCNPYEDKPRVSSNSIFVIVPYHHGETWVFDDLNVGLYKEPFVAGIPELIDKMVADIPNADEGFRLLFSATPFPGYTNKLTWRRKQAGGNWYYSGEFKAEGWLCPALFKYFTKAPKEIYIKAEPK